MTKDLSSMRANRPIAVCLLCLAVQTTAFLSSLSTSRCSAEVVSRAQRRPAATTGLCRLSMAVADSDSSRPTASRWGRQSRERQAVAAQRERVVILGGGFAGLYTALKLAQLPTRGGAPAPEVTLVDKKDKFVFTPLLYELAGKNQSPYARLSHWSHSSQCPFHVLATYDTARHSWTSECE